MVIQWIKGSKENVYKNRLDWVTKHNELSEAVCIWPLKSEMNLVWQKLNLGMVSEAMCKTASLICEEERVAWVEHCCENGIEQFIDDEQLFAQSIWSWFGRLVASQKHPLNFGDKENKHNHALLGILGRHGMLTLAGRSVDQWEEDELLTQWPKYTLEDHGFTWERVPQAVYYH